MSRSTIVYMVMVVVSAAGLWAILRAGYVLQAPVDLSGVWSIGGEDPAVAETLGESVNIEQSGKFVRLNFQRGLTVDVKLAGDSAVPSTSPRKNLDVFFESSDWKLTALGGSAEGPLIFQLIGPEKHTFTATRHAAKAVHTEITAVSEVTSETVDAEPAESDAP